MIKFHNVDQNSDEWFELRRGKITGSVLKDVFASKTTQAYKKAINKLAFEQASTEEPEDKELSKARGGYLDRGHELEPFAIKAFEMETFATVDNGGFYEYSSYLGTSPDGICGDHVVEVKCPAYTTMVQYINDKVIPKEYELQCQHHLFCTGLDLGYFVAFHPNFEVLIIEFEKDDKIQTKIVEKTTEAIAEIKSRVEKLKQYLK